VIAIDSARTILSTGKTSHEARYYLSSLEVEEKSPSQCLDLIRGHWGSIENRNHWIRDHCLNEDRTRTKNPTIIANLSLIRSALLPLLRSESRSATHTLESCAYDPQLALDLISNHL